MAEEAGHGTEHAPPIVDRAAQGRRKWARVLGQLALLIVIVAVIVAYGIWELVLFAVFQFYQLWSTRPILAVGVLLLAGLLLYLCIRGTAMTSVKSVYFSSRAILLVLSVGVSAVAIEPVYAGLFGLITGLAGPWESLLWLGGGLIPVALSAAGIRHAFSWRVRYWIVFLAIAGALLLLVFALAAGPFLGIG